MQKVGLVVVLLSTMMSFGQKNFNRFSVETGLGYVIPSKLYGDDLNKDINFSGFDHFDIGVRYMIKSNFGVKVNYARVTISKDNLGVSYNAINAAAVYNVGSLFDLNRMTNERIGLLGRVGVGLSYGKPSSIDDTDRTGTATIGLTPQIKITEQVSFYGDLAYAVRFKQHYGFDGVVLHDDLSAEVGKAATISFGLMLNLGDKVKHADWY